MALIDNRSSDPTDPLQQHSSFSICHQTYKDFPAPNDSNDLDSVHNSLKSTVLNNSDKLFDEAKAFVDSEVLGSKLAPIGASENNNEAVTKIKRNPKERRPGLGLKRARPSFCLKPDKGPSVSLETTLDIDKLQDPEEFFSAFYKQEFAREIIERQTGGTTTRKNDNNPPANHRRRRPSLFGKKATYKHKFSSAIPENDDTITASQETLYQDNLSPSNFVSQKHNVELQEGESGSVSTSENAAGGMLDELLSKDFEDLDGDETLKVLQEHLQIKPFDFDKYLHDFSDAGNSDKMDVEEEMPVRRKALSDIQNVVNGLINENPDNHKQATRNQSYYIMSSTPPERPSAAASLFGEGKSLSKPFHFPFSAADLDLAPAKSPTHEHLNGQSDNTGTTNEPSFHEEFNFQVEDDAKNPVCATSGSKQVIPGDSCLEKSASFNTSSIDTNTRTKDFHDGLVGTNECNYVGEILHGIVSSAQPDIVNDDLARGRSDTAVQAHGLTESDNVENTHQGASSTQPDANIVDSATDNLEISQSELGMMAFNFPFPPGDLLLNPNNEFLSEGYKKPIAADDQLIDVHTSNAESGLKQQNEEHPEISLKGRKKAGRPLGSKERKALTHRQSLAANIQECPEISLEDRRKAGKPRGSRERKALTRKQNLAAAGSCWNSGVRKSNRIKTRPLEYWKGERVLRGRVHESLDTVIGIKFISTPSPGGKVRRFKVESYVSDEQRELLESIALH